MGMNAGSAPPSQSNKDQTMKTINQYFPAMSESKGRSFALPSLPEMGLAAAMLAVALSGGIGYPLYQDHLLQARLDDANAPIVKSLDAAHASINHINALVAGQERYKQEVASNNVSAIQKSLNGVHTVSIDGVRADLTKQQKAYDDAQTLIANSPYKDKLFAFGPGADEYFAARNVQKPEPVTDVVSAAIDQANAQAAAASRARVYAESVERDILAMVSKGNIAQIADVKHAPVEAPAPSPVPAAAAASALVFPTQADDSPAAKAAAAKAAQERLVQDAKQVQAFMKTSDRASAQAAQKQLEQDAAQVQAMTQAADRAASQAKASAISRKSGNTADPDSVGNPSILGSRSPAEPQSAHKTPFRAAPRSVPIVTQHEAIGPAAHAQAAPQRPAQSDGFIEQ